MFKGLATGAVCTSRVQCRGRDLLRPECERAPCPLFTAARQGQRRRPSAVDRHIDLVMLAVAKGIIHETVKEAGRQVCSCADMRACACAVRAVAACRLLCSTRSLQRVSVRICSSILATMSARAQVRASVERQRDLQPERSEEVPVCDAFSGTPRKKVANLTFTIKQCRGLPAGTWESAGTVGTTDSYCVIKVCNAHSMRPSLARARVCARDVLTRAFSDTPSTETEPCEPGANRLSFDLRV